MSKIVKHTLKVLTIAGRYTLKGKLFFIALLCYLFYAQFEIRNLAECMLLLNLLYVPK